MTWTVVLIPAALRQYQRYVSRSPMKAKVDRILDNLRADPFAPGHSFKALKGELSGHYSRRVDAVNRVIYEVHHDRIIVKVVSVWGHYNDP
jgi:toxin YoeB